MPFEIAVLDWIQQNLRIGLMDRVMPTVTSLTDIGIVWIALTILLICLPKYRRTGIAAGAAILLTMAVVWILKPVILRPRPFVVNPEAELLIRISDPFSFPSGHTACSFSVTAVLLRRRSPLRIAALPIACLTAFSRLYLYLHFPTDVLAGVVIAFAMSFIAERICSVIYQYSDLRNNPVRPIGNLC